MHVQDLMSHPAITCSVHDNLNVPAQLMWDHDCGMIPVVRDDGKLVGVLTDRDICMAAYTQGRSLGEIDVSVVMTAHPVSARAEQDVTEVAHLMATHQVRRMPIVDREDRPVGVLSLNDLAREGIQPDTNLEEPFAQFARTNGAVCKHRSNAPRGSQQREVDSSKIEITPGWVGTIVEPYSIPAGGPRMSKAGAS